MAVYNISSRSIPKNEVCERERFFANFSTFISPSSGLPFGPSLGSHSVQIDRSSASLQERMKNPRHTSTFANLINFSSFLPPTPHSLTFRRLRQLLEVSKQFRRTICCPIKPYRLLQQPQTSLTQLDHWYV